MVSVPTVLPITRLVAALMVCLTIQLADAPMVNFGTVQLALLVIMEDALVAPAVLRQTRSEESIATVERTIRPPVMVAPVRSPGMVHLVPPPLAPSHGEEPLLVAILLLLINHLKWFLPPLALLCLKPALVLTDR